MSWRKVTAMKLMAVLALVITITACAGSGPSDAPPTASPVASAPAATASVASPTALPTPTSASSASATPTVAMTPSLLPTSAATALPTSSPTLQPTLTPTISPTAAPAGNLIELLAGGGTTPAANGVPALEAQLLRPSGVAVAGDGEIWIVDSNLSMLMRIAPDGTLADVATGMTGPDGVTVAPAGTDPSGPVHIAEKGGNRILLANGNGGVTRVAGAEFRPGFRGDGGPAQRAWLWGPSDVTSDANGNVFIADSVNHRIRVIAASTGIIETIVGTGTAGFSGDGGRATEATIYNPQAIAINPAGTVLLIADTGNGRIRRVDMPTGIITTIAGSGTGTIAYNPALTGPQTPLVRLAGLALDPQGNAYFEVAWGDIGVTIMRLDADGVLTLVAGGGRDLVPGGPALDFSLPDIIGLAIDPTGGALIICSSDSKVYRVPGVATPAP